MKATVLGLTTTIALCVLVFLVQSTGPMLADGLQLVSLEASSPHPYSSPTTVPSPVGLVAACLPLNMGCSSDAECCSHKCLVTRRGIAQCVTRNTGF